MSAALARSPAAPSALLLDAALDGRVELVASPTLLAEIRSVLMRPRLRRYLSLDEAARFVADLASLTTLATDGPRPHPAVCRDPNDDYLVALAMETGATAIVTGDRDLLEPPDPPLAVLTPREFLKRLDATEMSALTRHAGQSPGGDSATSAPPASVVLRPFRIALRTRSRTATPS